LKLIVQSNHHARKESSNNVLNRRRPIQTEIEPDGESDEPDGRVYEVKAIVGSRKVDGVIWYQVQWKGYSKKYNSWRKIEDLDHCLLKVAEFNQNSTIK
jgi:hypothetical protein